MCVWKEGCPATVILLLENSMMIHPKAHANDTRGSSTDIRPLQLEVLYGKPAFLDSFWTCNCLQLVLQAVASPS